MCDERPRLNIYGKAFTAVEAVLCDNKPGHSSYNAIIRLER